MNDRTNVRSDERRLIALEYITRAVDDLARASQARLEYMRLARQYGATYRQIATACGVTETAVRMLLKRHGEA